MNLPDSQPAPRTLSELLCLMRADVNANRGRQGVQVALILFRLSRHMRLSSSKAVRLASLPLGRLYKIYSIAFLGMDIPIQTDLGAAPVIFHTSGIVVNGTSVIGANVQFRHNVTLGSLRAGAPGPRLEDNVDLGVGATIIGSLTIGEGARVGANALVLRDVPRGGLAVSPAASLREPRHGHISNGEEAK